MALIWTEKQMCATENNETFAEKVIYEGDSVLQTNRINL